MTRFEDLPPVDLEGWLADQGRNFLQTTDQTISRLGLPTFISDTQQKIQGLGTDLSGIYTGLEQGLSRLPSAAQQASGDFLSQTGDRIGGLGQGLGTGLPQQAGSAFATGALGPILGPIVGGAAGAVGGRAGAAVGRGVRDVGAELASDLSRMGPQMGEQLEDAGERNRQASRSVFDSLTMQEPEQRERYEQNAQALAQQRSVFDESLSPMSRAPEQLGGLTSQTLQDLGGLNDRLQASLQRLRETRADELTPLARQGLDWAEEHIPPSPPMGRQATRLGGRPEQQRRMFETGVQSLRAALDRLDENTEKVRAAQAEAAQARERGDLVGQITPRLGALKDTAFTGLDVIAQPLRTFGQSYAGGNLPAGANRNLLGLPEDTPVLGGLGNPVTLAGEVAAAGAPTTALERAGVDVLGLVLGTLTRGGVKVGRPVVEAFVREVGEGTIRTALREGTESLGALFDDYVARAAARVPGGREGPLGRLVAEEEGGLRLPRPSRQITPAPPPGSPPAVTAPQTPGVQRALADAEGTAVAQEAASRTPTTPPKAPKGGLLETFDSLGSRLRELFTDEHARLADVQRGVERAIGRKLRPEENALLQRVLFAGRQSAGDARIEDQLDPILRDLSPNTVKRAENAAEQLDNADRAKAIQNRVTAEVAGTEVGPVAGETALRNARQSERMRRANLGKAIAAQDAADDAYRQAQAELRRVRTEGRREVRGSQGRGRRRVQRTPAEQARVEADVQARLDAARQATVDARAAAKQAAKDANVNLSKVTRADLKRMRLEGDVAARQLAEETEIAEGAAAQGAQAAASRQFAGGVKGDHSVEDIWEAQRIKTARELGQELGRPATQAEVDAEMATVRQAVDQLQAYSRDLRRRLRDAGIISQELYEKWERDFPHYIRTNILREMEQEAATPTAQGAQRYTVNSLTSGGMNLGARMTEEGSTALREQPVNTLIRMTYAAEALIRRNEGARALERLFKIDPEGATKELADEFRLLKGDEAPKAGEVVFAVRDNGEVRRYAVDERFQSLFALDPSQIRTALQTAGKWTGKDLFQAGATTYNLPWIALNAMRDAQVYLRRSARNVKEVPGAVADLGRAYRDLARTRGRGPAEWREALKAGAGQDASFAGLTPQQVRNRLVADPAVAKRAQTVSSPGAARKALDAAITGRLSPIGATGRGVAALGKGIKETGRLVETAPRLAAYRRELGRGASVPEAARASREVTLDFSRGGTAARNANAVLPFFNAAIQGTARFVGDDLKNRPLATAAQLASIVTLKAGLDAYNRTYGAEFDDVPNYLKDTGLIFMLPGDVEPETRPDGSPVPGQRNFLYVPMPQDMAALIRVGSQAMRRAGGEEQFGLDTLRGWLELGGDALGAASPVPLEQGLPLPPPARQLVEQGANYDFFRRRQIVPEHLQQRPASEQATDQTSALGRVVGGVTGRVSPLGPARVDYAVRGMLGGAGGQALRASDVLARAVGRDDLAARPYSRPEHTSIDEILRGSPLVGDLLSGVVRQSGGQIDETARVRLAGDAERRKDEVRAQLERSPGWDSLPVSQREAILDDLYRSIDEEFRRRGGDERFVRQALRAGAQRG